MTPLLCIQNVSKQFTIGRDTYHAVSNFSLDVYPGEVVGLAGESGSGKTTIGKMIVRLLTPSSGRILFSDADIFDLSANAMRELRRHMQIVLQDPYGSLNPKRTVGQIIGEGLVIHGVHSKSLIEEALEEVKLPMAFMSRYPHELSGGQRQRVSIARALVLRPKFIVFDESVSALDVSHQRQIISLLKDLQARHQLTYMFISHDLSVLKAICDRIGIMHRGRLVELGAASEILTIPKHPYTQALIAAIPKIAPRQDS